MSKDDDTPTTAAEAAGNPLKRAKSPATTSGQPQERVEVKSIKIVPKDSLK